MKRVELCDNAQMLCGRNNHCLHIFNGHRKVCKCSKQNAPKCPLCNRCYQPSPSLGWQQPIAICAICQLLQSAPPQTRNRLLPSHGFLLLPSVLLHQTQCRMTASIFDVALTISTSSSSMATERSESASCKHRKMRTEYSRYT